MCRFITLIAPTEDQAALEAVMAEHDRRARPSTSPWIAKLLLPDERKYLTFRAHCECGTVLGWPKQERDAAVDERIAHEAARMRRKGWSPTKIARALEGKCRAQERPPRRPLDSHDLWERIVADLLARLELPRVGLFVHSYSGGLEEERIEALRIDVPAGRTLLAAIEEMSEDAVTIFPAGASRPSDRPALAIT